MTNNEQLILHYKTQRKIAQENIKNMNEQIKLLTARVAAEKKKEAAKKSADKKSSTAQKKK